MTTKQKLAHELKAVGLAALYFGVWLGSLVLLKRLVLEEYQIEFGGLSMVLMGALILSKVVLILEHVSLGSWVRRQPAWMEVLLRTALYVAGVVVVLLLEKGFEGRHEHGGFGASLMAVFQGAKLQHILANTICVTGALLLWNLSSVVVRHLGRGALLRMLRVPLPEGG